MAKKQIICGVFLYNVQNNMAALRKFICFWYDGDNLSNTGARQMKFITELDHRGARYV